MTRLLFLTLAALASLPADAHAMAAALVAAAGITGTAASIATAVINFTLAQVASTLVTKLFEPKQSGVAAQQASVTSISLGEGPAQVVLGRALVGGTLCDGFNWGNNNEWETLVIVLADHACAALEGVWVNDTFVPFTGDGRYGAPFHDAAGHEGLIVRFRDGSYPAQYAPQECLDYGGWSLDDKMHGRCYVAVSYLFQAFQQTGRPRLAFQLRGYKGYDPRLDSTVAGGSGPQRFADLSTYAWSDNAAWIAENFAWGIRARGYDGAVHTMAGPGRSLAEHPAADAFARLNRCDEDVPLKAGGAEKRWRLSAVVDADTPWRGVLEDFATSCGGDLVDRRGQLVVEPGGAGTPLTAFTDDALIVGAPVVFQREQPVDRLANTVVARYVEPAQQWKAVSAPVRRSAADIAADGRVREQTLDLKHCPSGTQAQRVAEIARRKARLQRSATVTLGPRWEGVEAGDWLPWQSARKFAGASVAFQVAGVDGGESGQTTLTLAETSAQAYAWNPTLDELTPGANVFVASAGRPPLTVAGLALTAATEGLSGGTIPTILVHWTPVDDPACTELRAEFRRTGTTAVETRVFSNPAAGVETIRGGLEHDVSYEVRLAPVATGARQALPTAWVEVTTNALALVDVEGLLAAARPDGVTLTWTQSLQPEAVGYDVRQAGAPGTAWADAAVVQAGYAGTSLFVPVETSAAQTFLVRARDRHGRLSPESTAARVTASVSTPDDVPSFDAAPNGDLVRFVWGEVTGANAGYEIRSGLSWALGRVVDRPGGFSTTVQWPILTEADAIFWIKARTRAGLYSADARVVVARAAPLANRNVIYARDLDAAGWPGVRHDFSIDGALLTLDQSAGVSLPFGDYYDEIPLDRSFYARAWIDTRANAVVGVSPKWDDVVAAWDDLGDATWDPPLGDAGTARLEPRIAPALLALPDTLVEGFRLNVDDTGVRGGAPFLSYGVTRSACLAAPGAELGAGAGLGWSVTAAGAISLLLDVAPKGAQSGVAAVLTLANSGTGAWLQVTRNASAGTLTATTSTGQSATVSCPFVAGDVVRLGLYRTATELRLFAATRRSPAVRQAAVTIPAAVTYDRLFLGAAAAADAIAWDSYVGDWDSEARPWDALYGETGAVTARAPASFGDVELHNSAAVAAAFAATWFLRGPVGFEPWRSFTPGDYRIQHAGIWLRLEAPDPVAQVLAIPKADVFVDVPDVIDKLKATLTATASTTLSFARPFYEAPNVTAEFRGGATLALPRVLSVTATEVEVALVDFTDRTTPVAGEIELIAAGF